MGESRGQGRIPWPAASESALKPLRLQRAPWGASRGQGRVPWPASSESALKPLRLQRAPGVHPGGGASAPGVLLPPAGHVWGDSRPTGRATRFRVGSDLHGTAEATFLGGVCAKPLGSADIGTSLEADLIGDRPLRTRTPPCRFVSAARRARAPIGPTCSRSTLAASQLACSATPEVARRDVRSGAGSAPPHAGFLPPRGAGWKVTRTQGWILGGAFPPVGGVARSGGRASSPPPALPGALWRPS